MRHRITSLPFVAAGLVLATACAETSTAPEGANQMVTLHITITTTGASIDPDGYSLCIDEGGGWEGCALDLGISANGDVPVRVATGSHVVVLYDVAPNCTVSGDKNRTVTANANTEVRFAVTCTAAGSVRVTTATNGIDLDPSYLVCIDHSGNGCYWYVAVRANETVAIPAVIPGPHSVTLTDVAGNCTISGPTTRAVTISQDGTVDVTFDVGCVKLGGLRSQVPER